MKIQQQEADAIVINPKGTITHSIIWLHGLGADGNDFVPIVSELNLPPTFNIRFIFPHAPIMPVTINNGYKMRAWFDIYNTSISSKIDKAGITKSQQLLEKLIQQEMHKDVASENIILAGFSQGAVLALTTGLLYEKKLGGIIALSGFLPLADQVLSNASKTNKNTPIFIAHGSEDSMVPYKLGEATAQILINMHYPVSWHTYPMAHSVCGEEIADIREWLVKNK